MEPVECAPSELGGPPLHWVGVRAGGPASERASGSIISFSDHDIDAIGTKKKSATNWRLQRGALLASLDSWEAPVRKRREPESDLRPQSCAGCQALSRDLISGRASSGRKGRTFPD